MELNCYSVFDVKARAFITPFFLVNDDMAVRAFADACNDRQTMMGKWPVDFRLYRVGRFDDSTGMMLPEPQNYLVCDGISVVAPKPPFDLSEMSQADLDRLRDHFAVLGTKE